jgi:tetratricopeptide (TPR) repeat protein
VDARQLLDAGRYTEVATLLQGSEAPGDLVLLGEALRALGCFKRSAEVLRHAVAADRENAAARSQLAYAYSALRRPDRELKHLKRALSLAEDPLRSRVLGIVACSYAGVGRLRTAELFLAEALASPVEGKARAAVLDCASYVRMLGADHTAALDFVQQALQIQPDRPASYLQLGQVCLYRSEPEKTREALARAVELSPEYVLLRYRYAQVLATLELWDEAITQLSSLLALSPKCDFAEGVYLLLGDCYYDSGRWDAAIAAYEEAARYSEQQPALGDRLAANLRSCEEGRRVRSREVPRIRQRMDWCGPSCLAMVLGAWGDQVSQDFVAPPPTERGLSPAGMIAKARARGFAAEMTFGDLELLRKFLEAGVPVIVTISNACFSHYQVVVGYDECKGALVIQDTNGFRPVHRLTEDFLKLWSHSGFWMAVIVPQKEEERLRELRSTGREARFLMTQFTSDNGDYRWRRNAALAKGRKEICMQNAWLARCAMLELAYSGDTHELFAWLAEAEQRFPDHSWVHSIRARQLAHQKQRPEAIEEALAALALEKGDWEAHLTLARVYREQERWMPALRHARMAVEIERRDPKTHQALADLLRQRGVLDAAAEHYEAAVELEPAHLRSLMGLIRVYLELGRREAAESVLPKAEQLASSNSEVWTLLGHAYAELERADDAERCYHRAKALDPGQAKAGNRLKRPRPR